MSLGFWLHHAAPAWYQVFDRRLRPLNLTPTQFMLLASAGWLTATRRSDPADGRVKRLLLTPEGRELVQRGIR